MELTILMPCLNEAETIETCIRKANTALRRAGVDGEVLIADNGSVDGSQAIALAAGARLVRVDRKGYGAALLGGIEAAHGRYIVMGDADDSYDFSSIMPFVEQLREGSQLVMGNRFKGGIEPGAMPLLHRYLGNPVLSFLGRLFFKADIGDFHCGLRGFHRDAILNLKLTTDGMEFASEMVVKAAMAGLQISEVPTRLARDGRSRPPHLRTWRDGWRHLRFLLMLSPRWLFLYPGLFLLVFGLLLQTVLFHGGVRIGGVGLDIHTMLYGSAMSVLGLQMLWLAIFAKIYGAAIGLLQPHTRLERLLGLFTLERGLMVGLVLLIGGFMLSARAVGFWADAGYGELDPHSVMRIAIPAVSMMLLGMECCLASFFLGILRMGQSEREFREGTTVGERLPSSVS